MSSNTIRENASCNERDPLKTQTLLDLLAPSMKRDKASSLETFGPYIHTYKYDEAVADKVILDLRYEARTVEQKPTNPEKVDQWFDAKTQGSMISLRLN